jgi:hypothetical protein
MSKLLSLIGLAAFGAALCAGTAIQAQPGQSCFNVDQIQNRRLIDHRMLLLRVSGRIYEMDFAGYCDPNDAGVVFHPVTNSGVICGAIDVNVSGREHGGLCMARSLRLLSPAEVAALPPADVP